MHFVNTPQARVTQATRVCGKDLAGVRRSCGSQRNQRSRRAGCVHNRRTGRLVTEGKLVEMIARVDRTNHALGSSKGSVRMARQWASADEQTSSFANYECLVSLKHVAGERDSSVSHRRRCREEETPQGPVRSRLLASIVHARRGKYYTDGECQPMYRARPCWDVNAALAPSAGRPGGGRRLNRIAIFHPCRSSIGPAVIIRLNLRCTMYIVAVALEISTQAQCHNANAQSNAYWLAPQRQQVSDEPNICCTIS